jgi:hypothetical protein
MRKFSIVRLVTTIIIILASGCATLPQEWREARSKDTIQAYEEFLENHSSGEIADQARTRLEAMRRDLPEWEKAVEQNTIDGYEDFINQHPDSPFAEKAEAKIVDLEVKAIMLFEHSEAPSPSRINSGGNRSFSVINIFNNTQYNLTIRYSGPESFKVFFSPQEKGSIEILCGHYYIVSSVDATNVLHYIGEENLDSGNFEIEYYIKSRFSPPKINVPKIYFGKAPPFEPWPNKRRVPDYLK